MVDVVWAATACRGTAKTGSRGTPSVTVLVAVLVATTASVFPITKLEGDGQRRFTVSAGVARPDPTFSGVHSSVGAVT